MLTDSNNNNIIYRQKEDGDEELSSNLRLRNRSFEMRSNLKMRVEMEDSGFAAESSGNEEVKNVDKSEGNTDSVSRRRWRLKKNFGSSPSYVRCLMMFVILAASVFTVLSLSKVTQNDRMGNNGKYESLEYAHQRRYGSVDVDNEVGKTNDDFAAVQDLMEKIVAQDDILDRKRRSSHSGEPFRNAKTGPEVFRGAKNAEEPFRRQ